MVNDSARRTRFFAFALLALVSRAAAEDARAPAGENPASEAPTSPVESAPKTGSGSDRAAIDGELSQILDELVEARARAAFLGKRLFDTQLTVSVTRKGEAQTLTHLRVSLDGAPVHESDGQSVLRGTARVFEGAVAEGMHELSIELTEHAKADPAFENVRKERFKLKVRRKQRTEVELVVRDRSDLAEETAEGDDGELDVSTRVRVTSREVKPK